jgi:hypothetical protein
LVASAIGNRHYQDHTHVARLAVLFAPLAARTGNSRKKARQSSPTTPAKSNRQFAIAHNTNRKTMKTYTDLYKLRSDLERRLNEIKTDRSLWREYILLSDQVKQITAELKRLAK